MAKPEAIRPATRTKHIYICVFGEPGIGKTRLVGTSASCTGRDGRPARVLVIRPPVDHIDAMLPANKKRVEEWVIQDWDDMNQALDFLRMEGEQYDWVWVDSWSLLQDVLLDDLFETAVREKPARARYWADKQEYGINMGRIGAWMRHVVGPDKFNFGFTAHPAVMASPDLDEDGDPIEKLMPWIQGRNMSPKLCGYTNIVAFMEGVGQERKRVLRARSDERFYAKDQFDALPDGRLASPTMPKLVELINDSPGRKAEPATTNRTTRRRVVKK